MKRPKLIALDMDGTMLDVAVASEIISMAVWAI